MNVAIRVFVADLSSGLNYSHLPLLSTLNDQHPCIHEGEECPNTGLHGKRQAVGPLYNGGASVWCHRQNSYQGDEELRFPQHTVSANANVWMRAMWMLLIALGDANIPFIYEERSMSYGNGGGSQSGNWSTVISTSQWQGLQNLLENDDHRSPCTVLSIEHEGRHGQEKCRRLGPRLKSLTDDHNSSKHQISNAIISIRVE